MFYLPQLNNRKVVQLQMISQTKNYISGKFALYYLCVNAFRNRKSLFSP